MQVYLPLLNWKPVNGFLDAINEDPDEMPHSVASDSGLHLLLQLKQSLEAEIHYNLEILMVDPLIYIMKHPKFIVLNQMEEPISI